MAKSAEKRKGKEGIFSLIGKTFSTYFKNLNLALPFIFLLLFLIIVAAVFIATITPVTGTNVENLQLDPATLGMVAIVSIVLVLVLLAGSSFLSSGIIGMASEIASKGKTRLSVMFSTGGKYWFRFLGATLSILVIVLVPFLAVLFTANKFLYDSVPAAQLIAIILILLVLMLFFVFFAFAPYFLVMKDMRVFASIKESFAFVKKNYVDALLLFLILTITSILINQIPYVGWVINLLLLGPVQALVLVYFINSRK